MGRGQGLLFMSFWLYLTTSENHNSNWLGRCLFSITVSIIFLLLRPQNSSALVQVMGSTFPGCWG